MKFQTIPIIYILLFHVLNIPVGGFQSLPSLTNLAMINRLIKFYTLQSNTNRSELCAIQSDKFYKAVHNSELWAQQMIDASGKFPSGIVKIHVSDLGYFDECIQVQSETTSIMGKYCLATLKIQRFGSNFESNNEIKSKKSNYLSNVSGIALPRQIIPSWAICVPNGCTAKEVQDHLNTFAGIDIYKLDESKCQTIKTYKSNLNTGDWIVVVLLLILCVIIFISTVYDVYLYYTKSETTHPMLIAFSWLTNFQKLIRISYNPDLLPCLNGIRFLSMLWIILGHVYEAKKSILCANWLDLYYWMNKFFSMLIVGGTVSVDSFFLLGGCLLMYGFLKAQSKKIPFSIPLFYLHRYIRLTPSYAAAIIFMATLYRFMGSGPLWDPENRNEVCKTDWWAALLYIQNYVNENPCVAQSWYLQIDMQLYILAPVILLPIVKWPKLAWYILSLTLFVSTLIPITVAWHYKLPAFSGPQNGGIFDTTLMSVYYFPTYTRASPWVLGLLLGYVLFKTKNKKIALHPIVITALWITSVAVMLYTIFGFYHETKTGYEYDRVFNSLFIGLHRVVWSAGLSWIIFACIHGYGGPVNWFLSLPIFQVCSRLTYSIFITHIFLIKIHHESLQMPFLFSDMNVWYSFCGILVNVMIISLMWTITFESPFIIVDTLLMKFVSGLSKSKVVQTQNVSKDQIAQQN